MVLLSADTLKTYMVSMLFKRNGHLTSGCTGQISVVTFCAKTRTKAAIKILLGEPGVQAVEN